jgi:hypothetical protein
MDGKLGTIFTDGLACTGINPYVRFRSEQLLISRAVSMGRRNTKPEVYLLALHRLKPFASGDSNGTLPWLGSD